MRKKDVKPDFPSLASVTQGMKFSSTQTGKCCTRENNRHTSLGSQGKTKQNKTPSID